MAFSRFLESDVYVFEHVGGFIQCCGCWLSTGEREGWSYDAKTPREMLEHLDKHEAAGHDVDIARVRIIREYENLDAPIEPYKRSKEGEDRLKALIKERWNAREEDPHP